MIETNIDPIATTNNSTTMASTTTKQQELLQYIDKQVAVALQPWTAPIYCSVAFTPNPKPGFSLSQLQFSKQDIVSYMKQPMQSAFLSGRLYFDPSSYTVDSVDQLAFDLTASARENGFELIRNGRNSSNSCTVPGFPLRFRCSCMRVFRPSSKASTPSDYRPISFHNDRAKNSRGRKGKNGVRKAESKLPTSHTSICHFGFQLLADHHGIFIKVVSRYSCPTTDLLLSDGFSKWSCLIFLASISSRK